ncbi:hypothetical protein SAMN05216588_10567 [Pseudomonas flavescens]|uniref:Uncharacterized protein n=1 Tax=Phytopseudomonas flavescens TaxID=29435 RepID=A0A1G8CYC1_9GAMM|nr:hypothetical protein SAMN05216588_10567 [Pseudomonas flavescens]
MPAAPQKQTRKRSVLLYMSMTHFVRPFGGRTEVR